MHLCFSPAENKESLVGKIKEEKDQSDALESLHSKASSLEQGSTLRDLLTTTAGKLRLGSTDAGIAFAPVYSTASQVRKPTSTDHTQTERLYYHTDMATYTQPIKSMHKLDFKKLLIQRFMIKMSFFRHYIHMKNTNNKECRAATTNQ